MSNQILKHYKTAASKRYRFPSKKGQLNVEDLFILTMSQLNEIAKKLYAEVAAADDNKGSLEETSTTTNLEAKAKYEIVADIYNDKKKAKEAAEKAAATRQRNDRIRQLLAEKQDDELKSKSADELKALLEAEVAEVEA